MASFGEKDVKSGDVKGVEKSEWDDVVPKMIDSEDVMNLKKAAKKWEKMYSLAGMSTASEGEKKMLRAAVFVYGALNGTSREGNYSGELVLANGKSVQASIIPEAAGKFTIRQFYRASMDESYDFFKKSAVMEKYPRFITQASMLGVSADCAFAMSDWLMNCSKFTPAETKAHMASFNQGIDRARRSRGGNSLEKVEGERAHVALEAQGPSDSGKRVDF